MNQEAATSEKKEANHSGRIQHPGRNVVDHFAQHQSLDHRPVSGIAQLQSALGNNVVRSWELKDVDLRSNTPYQLQAQHGNMVVQFSNVGGQIGNVDDNTRTIESAKSRSNAGLPDSLRGGLESLSGLDLSNVRIHRNSSKPSEIDAFAYAQDQEIHLGPGQESYLAHEAWHIVQQMQGRVKPTIQAKGIDINDENSLEIEADRMGEYAKRLAQSQNKEHKFATRVPQSRPLSSPSSQLQQAPVQRAMKFEFQTSNYLWRVNKGQPRLLERKFGMKRSRARPYIARGEEGREAISEGDPVKGHKTKPAQYIRTYRVMKKAKGRVKLVKPVEQREGHRDSLQWGVYESRFVDSKGNELEGHLDENGKFVEEPKTIIRSAESKEQTSMELQAENKGYVEFETPKWFRKWKPLERRIKSAVEMTKKMSDTSLTVTDESTRDAVKKKISGLSISDELKERRIKRIDEGSLHKWPTSLDVSHLRLATGETLMVEVYNPSWSAKIQPSEGIWLTQFESLLKEHARPSYHGSVIGGASAIMSDTDFTGVGDIDTSNLQSFLQILIYYIMKGQRVDLRKENKKGEPTSERDPAKYAFRLMSRTSFSSMYRELISDEEKKIFEKLVESDRILDEANKQLGLTGDDKLDRESRFFKHGHGGGQGPKIHNWLSSIISPRKRSDKSGKIRNKKGEWTESDLLSRPYGGSHAMGAFDVETTEGEKDTNLVKFEIRGSRSHGGTSHPASNWVNYVKTVFTTAATRRSRPNAKDDPSTAENEAKRTGLVIPKSGKSGSTKQRGSNFQLQVTPQLTWGKNRGTGFDLTGEFRYHLPVLLETKLSPYVYSGVGIGGLSSGIGMQFDPVEDMSLFLAGKAGVRTPWFQSLEVGGGLEAGWAFGKSKSLRLGVSWEVWQEFTPESQRSHLAGLFFGYRFK